VRRYRFIHAERATYPVTVLCRVLRVSRAGYYAWAGRGASARAQADEELHLQLKEAHERSRGTYGVPRVHAALRAAGSRTSRRRVARPMQAAGLVGCCRRRRVRTTGADPAHAPAPNLVARDFTAAAVDRLWLGDLTYVPTQAGWRSLAILLDAHSRRSVGWAMADHLRTALALGALMMALARRRPGAGLVHHPDRGCHYTAAAYRQALAARGVVASMSRRGDCLDNAMAERFFATLKAELVDAQRWPTRAAAQTAIFAWIEAFYNRQRRHSALNYQPPVTFEEVVVLSCPAA